MNEEELHVTESQIVELPESRFPLVWFEETVAVVCRNCENGLRFSRVEADDTVDAVYVAERILEFAKDHTPCPHPKVQRFKVTL